MKCLIGQIPPFWFLASALLFVPSSLSSSSSFLPPLHLLLSDLLLFLFFLLPLLPFLLLHLLPVPLPLLNSSIFHPYPSYIPSYNWSSTSSYPCFSSFFPFFYSFLSLSSWSLFSLNDKLKSPVLALFMTKNYLCLPTNSCEELHGKVNIRFTLLFNELPHTSMCSNCLNRELLVVFDVLVYLKKVLNFIPLYVSRT